MLKMMRNKKVTKAILWGTLILILPAFVIWGAGSMSKSKEGGPKFAGTIDGKKVSFDDFAGALNAVRCQIFMNYFPEPKVMETLFKNKEFMGRLAWDMLIMSYETRKMKIRASDKEVVTFIRTHPLFTRDGKFDERMYEYILKNNLGLYTRNFEEIVRDNLAIQKLNNELTKDITITDAETLEAYKLDNGKFKVSYKFVDPNILKDEVTPPLFSKSDYIDGVGEAMPIAIAAVKMKLGETSAPVETRKGALTFKLLEIQGFDEEKFNKEKAEYTKRALMLKKNAYLENWLRGLETKAKLNIDLKEYDKYYK